MRKALLALSSLAPLLLGACATEPLPARFDGIALLEGEVDLACGSPRCALRWQRKQQAMTELHDAGDWRSLAQLVTSLGFDNDLSYFYLGRAAEELDAPEAAASYFDRALSAENKCENAFFYGCAGIDVTVEAMLRRERIAELLDPPEMDLVEAQTRLSRLGLYTIRIDGVSGPHTRAAIETFQERRGIPRSGKLDAPTRIALTKTLTADDVAAATAPGPRPSPSRAPAPNADAQAPVDTGEESTTDGVVAGMDGEDREALKGTASGERTRVTVEVDLLADADPFADVVEIVEQGSWVDVIDWGDEWSRVSHGNKTGYVYTEILQ